MVGRNSAALIAQIGKMTTPEITEGRSIDIAGAVRAGLEGYDWGNALRKQRELEANREALATALQAEDEAQIADAWAKADPMGYAQRLDQMKQARLEREQQLEDDELKFQRQLALKKAGLDLEKTYDITPQMKNIKYLVDSGEMTLPEAIDLVYGRNKPTNLTPYEKEKQKLKAQKEAQIEELKNVGESAIYLLDETIKQIKENPQLVGWKSGYKAGFGRYTDGSLGLSEMELEKRGELIRNIGIIKNDLIKEARSAGQTGINTVAEINQATLGIDELSSDKELIGALNAMKKARERLYKNKEKTTKAQQMQQGLSQIVPKEERQFTPADFSKQGKINYAEIYGFPK